MISEPDAAIHERARPVPTDAVPEASEYSPLNRLLPKLHDLGITRLGDITGLDRIGIPVAQATRPLGLANSVSQGKGLDLASAAVSAIMEAAEQFFAERLTRFRTTIASAEALGIRDGLLILHLMPGAQETWRAVETAWLEANDLINGRTGWSPFELVHTAYVEPSIPTDGLFLASTTGLACAFSERSATLHALLECIERDAIAKAHRTHGFFQKSRIDPETIEDAALSELVLRVRDAGLFAAFFAAPAAGGIPVVWCQIMEDGRRPMITPYPADGFAADLDASSAARRALLEAAQSRLAAISGSREDITRASFPRFTDWAAIDAHRKLLSEGPRPMALNHAREAPKAHHGDPLVQVLDRLAGDQITTVLALRLDTEPHADIAAIRVIVPELSPFNED